MLAREVVDGDQPLLGLMDITVRRNAFGRQVRSFEAELDIPVLAGEESELQGDTTAAATFPGIFIRAPWIEAVGKGVEILAEYDSHVVAARENRMLVTAFHPELTEDLRLHRFFLEMMS